MKNLFPSANKKPKSTTTSCVRLEEIGSHSQQSAKKSEFMYETLPEENEDDSRGRFAKE